MEFTKEEGLLFKRGYLLHENSIEFVKKGWENLFIDKYKIHFDPLNEYKYIYNEEKWVFILGYMIDTINIERNLEGIAWSLLDELNNSETSFFDYLDCLSGRYIILYHDGEKTSILSDATGMKSIVYSTDQTVISSHMNLVKEVVKARPNPKVKDEWAKKYKGYYIPGHHTPFENVYYLTPNTLLNVDSKDVVRFFPREEIAKKSIDSIVQEVSKLVKNQLNIISKQERPLLFSLTAGSDSRTTLALVKDYVQNIKFFTYYKRSKKIPEGIKSLEIDRQVVGEMVKNLNLHHEFIPLYEDDTSEEYRRFVELMKVNTIVPHSYRLAKFYLDELPNEALHIRSNILEIGRYFYRERYKLPRMADPKSLALCYSQLAKDDQDVIDVFSEYYDKVEMQNIYNYDGFDLFYWEFRMGIWHSKLLLESDVAHETFIPFNSRNILKLLLSVSDTDKKKNTVFQKIVEDSWPILNYWGINTLEKTQQELDEQIDRYGKSLQQVKFSTNIKSGKVKQYNYGNKLKFHIDKSNPEKGEYADATYTFGTTLSSWYYIMLQLRSPYESVKHTGRLKYQVLLNDEVLLEEDISSWREANQISIQFQAKEQKCILKVRVIATKDCEDWNWGKAGTIIIERLVLRKGLSTNDILETTSPFTVLLK